MIPEMHDRCWPSLPEMVQMVKNAPRRVFLHGREKHRWRSAFTKDAPQVFYGYDNLPGAGDLAAGGLVKTQDLTRRFPNTAKGANILYLISSALPEAAVTMAKCAQERGVKVVLNQDGVAYPGWHGPGWKRANAPMQALVHLADHVFFQSEFSWHSADRFLGTRINPSEVLYNPVDTSVFVPPPTRDAGTLKLLLTGSHWSFYRVETAVRTLAAVKGLGINARLQLAGRLCWRPTSAAAEADLWRLADELRVRGLIDWRGTYTQEQAVGLFQSAHVLLQTKYNDPCPRVVVEAMACGLPVVYSASGGVPELVGEEGGVGVPAPLDWQQDHPPTPAELANAVGKVWQSYAMYSRQARQRAVEKYDLRPWLDRHTQIFSGLLALR